MVYYLIVGLGNPDHKHRLSRHNLGFLVIDHLLEVFNIRSYKSEHHGHVYTYQPNDNTKVLFVKPMTYMNLSGNCVQSLMNYYKIPVDNLMVIYDDLDLAVGKLRFRFSGSSGGHNGLKNILQTLNTNYVKRLRIGIKDHDTFVYDYSHYVLSNFSENELERIKKQFDKITNLVNAFVQGLERTKILYQII